MRSLYTALMYLVLPFLPLRLWWRGRNEPGYREHVGERFGSYARAPAVRLPFFGSTRYRSAKRAHPFRSSSVRNEHFPAATILVTHMTATGRAAGRALFGDRVVQAWLPYDAPFAVRAFLAHWRPAAGLFMETELWPNVVAMASDAGRASLSRQRAIVRTLGPRLRARAVAHSADARCADRRRSAGGCRRRSALPRWVHARLLSPAISSSISKRRPTRKRSGASSRIDSAPDDRSLSRHRRATARKR